MAYLYELAVLGRPNADTLTDLEYAISSALDPFGLALGREVGWTLNPPSFQPVERRSAAVVFFGHEEARDDGLAWLIRHSVPILPVVSDFSRIAAEIPPLLRPFNAIALSQTNPERVATALLECAGLLPRQRRLFVSYRRDEARAAALQLFEAFSARGFAVFLDTHAIAPAVDFQEELWHRLCDSDVLVMLDTPTYFESRWTTAEFSRALAKGISVLSVGWPETELSPRASVANRVNLQSDDIDLATGRVSDEAVEKICQHVEMIRSQGHAVRHLNLVGKLAGEIERIGGALLGVGPRKAVYLRLPDEREIVVYPAVGVPTALTLQLACEPGESRSVAVAYDVVGLHHQWVAHLEWLGVHIRSGRWLKVHEAAWALAVWESPA